MSNLQNRVSKPQLMFWRQFKCFRK